MAIQPTYFKKFDAGLNVRQWDTGDCSVRAVAVAFEIPYLEAWELLYKLQGQDRACSFKLPEFLRRHPFHFPKLVEYIAFPAVRGRKRMTGAEFCRTHPNGRYMLRLAHHVCAAVDGQVIDRWNSTTKCVYGAWKVGD